MCPEGPEAYQFMSPCHTRPAPLGYPFVPLVEEWFPHKLPAWPEGMKKNRGGPWRLQPTPLRAKHYPQAPLRRLGLLPWMGNCLGVMRKLARVRPPSGA